MRSHLRQVASAGAVCLVCVTAALSPSSAVAGVNSWTAIGPDGANVVALVIDPAKPSTAFAGTTGSGVLKTTDGGASWATVNQGLPTASVQALVKDPSYDTLYAGTDAGVFKSTDGGQSWAAANDGLDGASPATANGLALEPWDGKEGIPAPATVYAATSQGLFKLLKGAGPWTSISVPTGFVPRVIAIDPISPSTLYLGVDDTNLGIDNGVLKSTDGGSSWARIYTVKSCFMCDEAPPVTGLAVDPHSPSRLYLAVAWSNLAMSADGGASWSVIEAPSGDTFSLAVDPTSFSTLYVGTYSGAVYRSIDAGGHWTPATDRLGGGSVNVIAMDASAPATIYAGGGTGIFRSSDAAQTWTQLTLGVRNTLIYPLAVDPGAPSTIYAGVGTSRALVKTTDGGAHWADSSLGLSNAWFNVLAIDPASPSTLYAASLPLFKTIDAGAHWVPVPVGLASIYEPSILVIAPSQPSTLYIAGNFAGVLKSTDGGSSWSRPSNSAIAMGVYVPAYVSALAVDPTDPDIVYLATSPDYQDTPKVFKSTDGATQWRQVPLALPTNTVITSLVIDPATPSTIYATYDGYGTVGVGVYTSSDSGETWIAPRNLLPTRRVSALAIDPTLPSRVYAATEDGVFRSTDGATSWTAINSGLPNVAVWALSIDRTGSILRGATAIGLFEYRTENAPGPPGTVPVIEYIRAAFGDYFITARPDEIAKLDSGAITGWARTGFQFNAYATPRDGASPVCRFLNTAFLPKSPHFHTPFAPECAAVRTDPSWLLESGAAFYIAVPAGDGSCPAGSTPVYRLYNNGQGGAPNHRYTTDLHVRAQMIAQGWVPEGLGADAVEMCSPQ